jgi:plasmid stabilization system protein ParE
VRRRAVVFRPEAEAEALQSQTWYEQRRSGLGAEFGEAMSDAVSRIVEQPTAYQAVRGSIRRAVLRRFPYAIYFRVDRDTIVILAVHGRQHPGRWQVRR